MLVRDISILINLLINLDQHKHLQCNDVQVYSIAN